MSAHHAKRLLSILDRPITVTRFLDQKAKKKREDVWSFRDIARYAKQHRKANKADLEWIKLATFGDEPSNNGSLRYDRNMLSITGVEGDYDLGAMTPETAAEKLKAAGIASLIYTSHRTDIRIR